MFVDALCVTMLGCNPDPRVRDFVCEADMTAASLPVTRIKTSAALPSTRTGAGLNSERDIQFLRPDHRGRRGLGSRRGICRRCRCGRRRGSVDSRSDGDFSAGLRRSPRFAHDFLLRRLRGFRRWLCRRLRFGFVGVFRQQGANGRERFAAIELAFFHLLLPGHDHRLGRTAPMRDLLRRSTVTARRGRAPRRRPPAASISHIAPAMPAAACPELSSMTVFRFARQPIIGRLVHRQHEISPCSTANSANRYGS